MGGGQLYDLDDEEFLRKWLKDFFERYQKPEITIRYLDFHAPEHGNHIAQYRDSLPDKTRIYAVQTKAVLKAAQDAGYTGKINFLAPQIRSYEEAEEIHRTFLKAQEGLPGATKMHVAYCSKIETLQAAADIKRLAQHFNLMFEFGDLAREYYKVDRTDAQAIAAFQAQKGFNPYEKLSPDFLRWTEKLVKEALKANPQCHITFAGEHLNKEFGLIQLAQRYRGNVDICIRPEPKCHAAALFAYNALEKLPMKGLG